MPPHPSPIVSVSQPFLPYSYMPSLDASGHDYTTLLLPHCPHVLHLPTWRPHHPTPPLNKPLSGIGAGRNCHLWQEWWVGGNGWSVSMYVPTATALPPAHTALHTHPPTPHTHFTHTLWFVGAGCVMTCISCGHSLHSCPPYACNVPYYVLLP